MARQDDWADRTVKIEFLYESHGDQKKIRTFRKISGDVSHEQILRFSKAISQLTPNGKDGEIMTDMYDHFLLDPDD